MFACFSPEISILLQQPLRGTDLWMEDKKEMEHYAVLLHEIGFSV
jgi:hypothetical protein